METLFAGKEIDDPRMPASCRWWPSKASSKGIMASGTVNFVNAGLLAEQTGIQVRETISSTAATTATSSSSS